MRFADASAVRRVDETTWEAEVQPGWDILTIANGGYLMAIGARAMSGAADGRVPLSLTSHFTRAVAPGPVRIEVEMVKMGRRLSTLQARMTSGDASLLSLIGSFGDPGRTDPGNLYMGAEMPEMPPPEECVRALPATEGPIPPPLMARLEERIHPDDAKVLDGKPSGVARIRGWFRLLDDEPLDPFALILAADAFPPAIFNIDLPMAWTPTLEMTTHIRSLHPEGWLRCQFVTRFVTGGFLEEDGEIWDEKGHLVALSRQLALVPRQNSV